MNTANEFTARVIGEIIAKGMNMSDFDVGKMTENAAIGALDEINLIVHNSAATSGKKITAIENVLKKWGVTQKEP